MLRIILCSLLLWSSVCAGEETFISHKCDHLGVNGLLGLGLKPQFENNELCPTSWTWPEEKDELCYYKGNYYQHGENFIKKDENSETSCKCNVRKGNKRFVCENANWTSTWEELDMNYTCESEKYNGNQQFWPEDTCMRCKCKPGFNGEITSPFCERTNNDISMQYQKEICNKCTPYYYNYNANPKPALCTPAGFICDEDMYEVSPMYVVTDRVDSNVMCKMDDKLYPKGTVLNVTFINYNSKTNVNCTCSSPPLFTCVNTVIYSWSEPIEAVDILPMPAMPEIIFPQITMPESDIKIPAIPIVDSNIPEVVKPESTSKIIEEMLQEAGKRYKREVEEEDAKNCDGKVPDLNQSSAQSVADEDKEKEEDGGRDKGPPMEAEDEEKEEDGGRDKREVDESNAVEEPIDEPQPPMEAEDEEKEEDGGRDKREVDESNAVEEPIDEPQPPMEAEDEEKEEDGGRDKREVDESNAVEEPIDEPQPPMEAEDEEKEEDGGRDKREVDESNAVEEPIDEPQPPMEAEDEEKEEDGGRDKREVDESNAVEEPIDEPQPPMEAEDEEKEEDGGRDNESSA